MAKRTRRSFTSQSKREAVRLAQRPDGPRFEWRRSWDHTVLRRWVQQFETGNWDEPAGAAMKSKRTDEVEHLRREFEHVKAERDVLRKALAYLAEEHS